MTGRELLKALQQMPDSDLDLDVYFTGPKGYFFFADCIMKMGSKPPHLIRDRVDRAGMPVWDPDPDSNKNEKLFIFKK